MHKNFILIHLITILNFYTLFSYEVLALGDSHIMFNLQTQFKPENHSFSRIINKKETDIINFHLKWLGPRTLHGAYKLPLLGHILQYDITKLDAVIFSFGEIDARCHIKKQSLLQNKPFEEIIDVLMQNFFNSLETIRESLPNYKGVYIIMAVIPPVENPNRDDASYPMIGTLEERAHIVYLLNKKFEEYSSHHNVFFFNPHLSVISDKGTLPTQYSDRHVHFDIESNNIIVSELWSFLKTIIAK